MNALIAPDKRAFYQNNIAGVQEYTSGEIQTLLRTGGHEDVVSAGLDIELRFHAISDLLTEVLKTVGAGVLERDLACSSRTASVAA